MEKALEVPAEQLCKTAEAFGERMKIPVQTFRAVVKAACEIETASPRTRSLVPPLEDHLDSLDELSSALQETDVLYHQLCLLSTTADALVWVSTESPQECVEDASEKAKAKLVKLREMHHPSHAAYADAVTDFLRAVEEYVADKVAAPLVFED